MNSYDVLKTLDMIGATNSRTEKEEILGRVITDPLMQEVVKWTCDPFITFGITPPKVESDGAKVFTHDTPTIWGLLHALKDRKLTGNDAADTVLQTMMTLQQESADLLWRILSKDLRCGITHKSVNKLLPGTIPTFDVMLSKPYEEKRIKSWPVAVEPKLDGLRAMIICKSGVAKAYSRVGNHFPALDHLSDMIAEMVSNAITATASRAAVPNEKLAEVYFKMLGGDSRNPSLAIDTEALTGNFNKTSGDVKRKSKQAEDIILNVFDCVPAKLMTGDAQEIKIPFGVRRKFTEFVVGCAPKGAAIRFTPLRLAHSHDEVMAIYEDHRSTTLASYIANGDAALEALLQPETLDKASGLPKVLEGAMVKLLDASYVKKKGTLWMKIKAEETEDLRVIDIEEGTGKNEGRLGALVVDRLGVRVKVGGGFSDALRDELWADYWADAADGGSRVHGRLIEIEFHEVTPDGSLRHPRFVRFRDDKDEEKRAA